MNNSIHGKKNFLRVGRGMDNGQKNAAGTMLVCSAVVNWYSSRGSQKQNRKCTCSFRVIWSEKVKLGTFVSLKKQTSNLPVQWLIVIATIHPVFYNPCHMVQQLNVLCDKLSIEIWCLKQSIQPVMRWPVILIRAIPWMSFSLTAPPPLQSAFGFPSFHSARNGIVPTSCGRVISLLHWGCK